METLLNIMSRKRATENFHIPPAIALSYIERNYFENAIECEQMRMAKMLSMVLPLRHFTDKTPHENIIHRVRNRHPFIYIRI